MTLFSAVFWVVLGGCSAPGGPASAPLRVALWAGGQELQVEQRVVDSYHAKNPGARVVLESAPNGYEERLLTSIAGQHPPDVFLLDGPDVPTFVERGLAMDLAPFAEALGFDERAVFPEVIRAFRRDSSLYAFPKDFTPMVLYAHRDLLRPSGVEEPSPEGWTWGEFGEAMRRVRARFPAGDVYGFDFPRNLYQWVPFVWSAGGDILGEAPDGSMRAVGFLDGPRALRAFEFLVQTVEEGLTPRPQFLQSGDPAREARFAAGKQAFLLSGHWTLPVFRSLMEEDALDLGILPIPHHDSQSRATSVIYASAWAIPVNAPYPRRSLHLAAYLASPAAQLIRAEAGLAIPSVIDIARERAVLDDAGIEEAFLILAEGARMTWGAHVRDFSRVETLAAEIMDRRLLLNEPLAEAASAVARAIDSELVAALGR